MKEEVDDLKDEVESVNMNTSSGMVFKTGIVGIFAAAFDELKAEIDSSRFLMPYRSQNYRKRGHDQLTPVPHTDGRLPPAELRPKTRDELLSWSLTQLNALLAWYELEEQETWDSATFELGKYLGVTVCTPEH
ncbi:uncharacterized protein STEHIDRAFT_149661 [Stereum hirsutum FP-91666 SS1]|uniref:uncharacterized protein n=1 Tax=Stereum hirsutum (strain FP-91666) TaxID=721885 RepID=UPI000444A182|nr:uncharacterized protein STEHIDRAFT_149661 [Stereum hirsutum FP-91666 SS1]EIM81906.1 hypothetical protein STEHIDRAFT_149661 [Stereum hirsutum FP-91666 SS1]